MNDRDIAVILQGEPIIRIVDEAQAIYVAGPLRDKEVHFYLQNVANMIDRAILALLKGHSPYIPCLDLLLGIKHGSMVFEDYFEISQAWLRRADAIWHEPSPGADIELDTAMTLGLTIYRRLYDIPWTRVAYISARQKYGLFAEEQDISQEG